MKTQIWNLLHTPIPMVAVALLAGPSAQASTIDTALQITVGGTPTCLFGGATNNVSGTPCDSATLQNGAINGPGNASLIPLTPYSVNYTFATGDTFMFSGAYLASYSSSAGTFYVVQAMLTYLGTTGGGNSKGDIFSLDFLQDFYDGSAGSFSGSYTEDVRPIVISPTMPASASIQAQFSWGGQGVGLLGPYTGPGSYFGRTTSNLTGLAVNYLPADFDLILNVPAGAAPGSFISVNITPEPAETIPCALACCFFAYAAILSRARKQAHILASQPNSNSQPI